MEKCDFIVTLKVKFGSHVVMPSSNQDLLIQTEPPKPKLYVSSAEYVANDLNRGFGSCCSTVEREYLRK